MGATDRTHVLAAFALFVSLGALLAALLIKPRSTTTTTTLSTTTLPDLYPGTTRVGNETCRPFFDRLSTGLVGDFVCEPPSGLTPGQVCPTNGAYVITNAVVNGDRIAAFNCTPFTQTNLNGSVAGGDLKGVYPSPTLIDVNINGTGCSDGASTIYCFDSAGRMTNRTASGNVFVQNNTAVTSPSGTIVGSWGVLLDLVQQYVINNTAVLSTTLTGSWGTQLELQPTGVVPGPYGYNSSCLAAVTIDIYGRATAASCFSIAGLGAGNGSGFSVFLGTPNQVIVTTPNNFTVQFATPQDIATSSAVTFASMTLSSLAANRLMLTGVGGAVTTMSAGTNGQVPIAVTGGAPIWAAITGTANQVIVTSGAGSITLSLPQNIGTANNVVFNSLTLSGLTANRPVITGASGLLSTPFALLTGELLGGVTSGAPVPYVINSTTLSVTRVPGAITLEIVSIPNTTALVVASLTVTSLAANRLMVTGVGGVVTTMAAGTNGQIPMGVTGGAPVWNAITGTPGQVTVTLGSGSTTLSLPQNISTTSNVVFNGLTLNGLTANRAVITGASGLLSTPFALATGELIGGVTGGAPIPYAINSTTLAITRGAGFITLESVATNFTLANTTALVVASLTITSLAANRLMVTGSGGQVTTMAAALNGQIPMGVTGSAPVWNTITGDNSITIANGAGTVGVQLNAVPIAKGLMLGTFGSFGSAGTISTGGVSSTAITGSGTSFSNNMIGSTIMLGTAPFETATILRVIDSTHIVVTNALTVSAGTSYTIWNSGGSQLSRGGAFLNNVLIVGPQPGLGLAQPNRAGITISGPASSNTGLGVLLGNRHALGLMSYTYDNNFVHFDAYFNPDTGQWESSDTSIAWRINKQSGQLKYDFASAGGGSAGTTITGWTSQVTMDTTGVNINNVLTLGTALYASQGGTGVAANLAGGKFMVSVAGSNGGTIVEDQNGGAEAGNGAGFTSGSCSFTFLKRAYRIGNLAVVTVRLPTLCTLSSSAYVTSTPLVATPGLLPTGTIYSSFGCSIVGVLRICAASLDSSGTLTLMMDDGSQLPGGNSIAYSDVSFAYNII